MGLYKHSVYYKANEMFIHFQTKCAYASQCYQGVDMPEDVIMVLVLFVVGAVAIWLLTKRWVWQIAIGLGAAASFFAMCASVIHFQILGAVGFLVLTWALSAAFALISE